VALALALPRFWDYDSRAEAEGVGAYVPKITDAPV
jgi:hypothetical protein